MFTLVDEVDAGEIWGQRRIEIGHSEYVGTVLSRLEDEAVTLVREVYPRMITGDVRPVAQDHSKATYCTLRTPDDGVIDWTWPAEQVLRFIRAQSRPYPGAFTYVHGERITIWRASLAGAESGSIGQIIRRVDNEVRVVCGDAQAIVVEEAQRGNTADSLSALPDGFTDRMDLHGPGHG